MRDTIAVVLVAVLVFATHSAQAENEHFKPFIVDWSYTGDSPVDLSFLLPEPAGREGFIQVRNGHLAYPDGSRFRIWGVNCSMQGTVPEKVHAPLIAQGLARRGINCVRFHHMDRTNAITDGKRNDTRHLDPERIDRLDFFVAELKKRGIYANLNLNVSRTFKAGDGVRDHEYIGYAKALTYFNKRLIELQKEYARQLLTHFNPYTQTEYRNEPAVVVVEMVNENSIIESWVANRLRGKNTRKHPGTWSDIPASYERELTSLYNVWLERHCDPLVLQRLRQEAGVAPDVPMPRLQTEEFQDASADRFHTEARFYMEMERDFFLDMERYLRDELKIRSLLAGSSLHNHGKSGYPHLVSTSLLDVVDDHCYWQHPVTRRDPTTGRRTGTTYRNTPMADEPRNSTVVRLSTYAVADKPYTISETNHPFPGDYSCEGIPILAGYGAFHDWDGIYLYSLSHSDVITMEHEMLGSFDMAQDPVKMTQLAAGALLFLRPDVTRARQTITRTYSKTELYETLRLPGSEKPYFTPGFPCALPLRHGVRVASLDGPPTGTFERIGDVDSIVSDTGELSWCHAGAKSGVVTIDTERTQAIIGFCRTNRQETSRLTVDVDTPFCAITLSSLDGQPIEDANHLLMTVTARSGNLGMKWNPDRTTLDDRGDAPTVIEVVSGTVTIKKLEKVKGIIAQPLDGAGAPCGAPVEAKRTGGDWSIVIGEEPTTWYDIVVTR